MPSLPHYLGSFYLSWSAFEATLELVCKRELGINYRQCHIVFGSLPFSTKMGIAISLLKESNNPKREEMIAVIKQIPQIARRNHITHSILALGLNKNFIDFWKRDTDRGLKTKRLRFTDQQMQSHFYELANTADKLDDLSGIGPRSRKAYLDAIQAAKQ